MKERGGINATGLFLLLCVCGRSNAQSWQHLSGDGRRRVGENSGGSGNRGLRGAVRDWGQLASQWDPGGSEGRQRTVPELLGQVESSRHGALVTPGGDRPGRARPSGGAVETVLGFHTGGEQTPRQGFAAQRSRNKQSVLGVAQKAANKGIGPVQRVPAVEASAGLPARQDVAIEVETGSGGAQHSSSGGLSTLRQGTPQTRSEQSRDAASDIRSGALSRRQRPAQPSGQLGRPAGAREETWPGGSVRRGFIPAGDGLPRPGRVSPVRTAADLPKWGTEAIPGQSGVDYPVLSRLPPSVFDCRSQDVDGFYADTSDESRCQAFWVCHNDQKDGFLCPNGTVFNQRYLACDWWFNVRCQDSPQYYGLNRNIDVTGTRITSRPPSAHAPLATSVHTVLTLLHDILQYPRVPPVLPASWPESPEDDQPVHSAAQPALPSRNQYSDDAFHAPNMSSVRVSGGIPGIPPAERHGDGQATRDASHEARSKAVKVAEGQTRKSRRYVKRHAKRTPKKFSKRSIKRHGGSRQLRRRKVREHDMVEYAEGPGSETFASSADISPVDQWAISQLAKRAPETSSGAFTSVQQSSMPDTQSPAQYSQLGPLLQTVDNVAFPLDARGPDFPKVEEDFNIQETSGMRKSTSIKDVLPSHIDLPQTDAVKVMAASGNQQNTGASSGPQSPVGDQVSVSDASGSQSPGVPGNYAGISLTEDVNLAKDPHGQAAGAMSDSESVSSNSGQRNSMALTEGAEFHKRNSVPEPAPVEMPQWGPEPQSMSMLESVAGGSSQSLGASVQENGQLDQKRDAAVAGPNQPSPVLSQSSNPAVGGSGIGGSIGPGVSLTENVHISPKGNSPPDLSNQGIQTNGSPSNEPNQATGPANVMSGGNGQGSGMPLTDNRQGSSPSGFSNQVAPAMPGAQSSLGGQTMSGSGDPGPAGGWAPADTGGHPAGQMNVEAFLTEQRGSGAPPPPPPSSGIRSEDSVQVDFDEASQEQHQGAPQENPTEVQSGQEQNPATQTPPEAEVAPNGTQPDHQPSGNGSPQGSGVKISPKAEQVLEEQSNVKILIPYEGQGGTANAPSESLVPDETAGDFGISNQVNSGIALGSAAAQTNPQVQPQSRPQGQPQDQAQDQQQSQPLGQPQGQPQDQQQSQPLGQSQGQSQGQPQGQQQSQSQGQPQGQLQDPSQGQPQGQSQGQPQGQLQDPSQGQPQGQQSQSSTPDLLKGNVPPSSGSIGVSSGSTPPKSSPGKNDVKVAEGVSVHQAPPAGTGPVSGSPAAGQSRPGVMHAGDSHMNASAMTVPKKEGSSKILEQLDAKSQFASNVGDTPGTVNTHVQMQEEKLGDKPGTSDLFDDPSALKREMPSENAKNSQQQTPPPEPQGEIIPGQKNVQITSESVSRIIKNPSRHRSDVRDPAGLYMPELLRPPGFGSNYSPFKSYPTLRTVKPVGPATPQPAVARLAGSIDMKPNTNAAGSFSAQTLTAGAPGGQPGTSNAGGSGNSQPAGLQRIQRGDLSTKLSETLKMVDNILGPPPFKSKRNSQFGVQRAAYLDTMESGHSGPVRGRGQKRSSEDQQDGNMGIDLTVLLNGQDKTSAHTGTATTAASPQQSSELTGPPSAHERERIRIFDSLKNLAHTNSKGIKHKAHKPKQTAKETKVKEVIKVKTAKQDDDKSYDYDISQLPSWMKKAVKSRA